MSDSISTSEVEAFTSEASSAAFEKPEAYLGRFEIAHRNDDIEIKDGTPVENLKWSYMSIADFLFKHEGFEINEKSAKLVEEVIMIYIQEHLANEKFLRLLDYYRYLTASGFFLVKKTKFLEADYLEIPFEAHGVSESGNYDGIIRISPLFLDTPIGKPLVYRMASIRFRYHSVNEKGEKSILTRYQTARWVETSYLHFLD